MLFRSNPTSKPDAAPYRIIQGSTGLGLNLDGKVGPNDFTSPLGDKGIDNQLYRAIGCTRNFRADGETAILTPQWRVKGRYNTYVIEITDVDDLQNDNDVTITTYRGMDKLIGDATGAMTAFNEAWNEKVMFHTCPVKIMSTDAISSPRLEPGNRCTNPRTRPGRKPSTGMLWSTSSRGPRIRSAPAMRAIA